MTERGLDAVPVLDADERVLGVVTARSIIEAAAGELPPWNSAWPDWPKGGNQSDCMPTVES